MSDSKDPGQPAVRPNKSVLIMNAGESASEQSITGQPSVAGTAESDQPAARAPVGGSMGALELAAYRADWRASFRYRRQVGEAEAARALSVTNPTQWEQEELESPLLQRGAQAPSHPVTPARVVSRLMFARMFDPRPELQEAICSSAPIVIIDVPDMEILDCVLATWQETLLPETARTMDISDSAYSRRGDYDVIYVAVKERPRASEKKARESEALAALALALPLIAISPLAETHLPEVLLKSRPVRLTFPRLDPVTIARTIRVVTGKRCHELLDCESVARITPVDLAVAVRFDRTLAECMTELRRLVAEKVPKRSGRDISLDELHGMDEAVAWARATIRDLEAWRRGEIAWSALDPGVCLVGPPGTGKTLFAECFARAAGLPMVACSLAKWQAADEGHLGHLLRAMKRDFDTARAQAPCLLFCDELDSFVDRRRVRHNHFDYVIETIGGFISLVDGIAGREGLLYAAAANDISRCDPAILRSGRFNRIIRLGLPNARDLERMFRVRLGGRLAGEDLEEICLLALGASGADVERITNDALRFARHANRPLELVDLRRAVVKEEDRAASETRRHAIHEASHLVAEIVLFGHEADVHATIARSQDRGGATVRTQMPPFAGTYSDYQRRLQVLLAGRMGEELVLGAASHGAGGSRGSDLQQATALAAAMVASVGIAGPRALLFLGPHDDTETLLQYVDVRFAAHAELKRAAELCRAMLLQHRAALDEIAARLLLAGRIDGRSATAIIGKHRE